LATRFPYRWQWKIACVALLALLLAIDPMAVGLSAASVNLLVSQGESSPDEAETEEAVEAATLSTRRRLPVARVTMRPAATRAAFHAATSPAPHALQPSPHGLGFALRC
jgi:hypothetical protein